jgi:16S rRNA (cytosine967-C5)-methyltransferase
MRWHKTSAEHAIVALAQVLNLEHAADGVLSRYFREHRELGHADRGLVAEAVYGVLRHLRSLATAGGALDDATPRQLFLAWLVREGGANLRQLDDFLKPGEREWLAGVKAFDAATLSAARRDELPDWLHERLLAQLGDAATAELAAALNQPAPLDLRVNTEKSTREAAQAALAAEGIEASPTPHSPFGLRLAGKPALAKNALFLDGRIEVQDEGSQLLGLLLAPKRGELVIDFCAGAGGKTLLLGALMRSSGRLYAFEVSERRLA